MERFLLLSLSLFLTAVFSVAQQPVGSLGGEVSVSHEGLASYSIPVEVPPGTHGVEPRLAVTYNSAGGRGLLGLCWTVTGLSSITRVPRDFYHDGDVGAVNFDARDRYALDGSRLVRLSGGDYAATGAVYGREVEDFTRVTLCGDPDTPTQWFTAVTADGTVVEYGGTANSRQRLDGKVLSWWVSRITDPDGNSMAFDYTGSAGEIVPSAIYYTRNESAGLSSYAGVFFSYTDDPHPNRSWVGGKSFTASRLLTGITVRYQQTVVREYAFEYAMDRSARLTTVVLKDGGGAELTRTAVGWGADGQAATFQTLPALQGLLARTGDFDGDNRADLFVYTFDTELQATPWSVWKGDGGGHFSQTSLSGTIQGYIPPGKIHVADHDGNGCDDVSYVLETLPGDSTQLRAVMFRTGTFHDTVLASVKDSEWLTGDFLGCGRLQTLQVSGPSGNTKTVTCTQNGASLTVHKDTRLSVTDLNGNGKSDIQAVRGHWIDVYEYDGQSGAFAKIADSNYVARTDIYRDYFGDVNGDGYTDYIYFTLNGFYLKMSKGNDYTSGEELPFDPSYANDGSPSCPLLVGDVNGDGKSDAVQLCYDYAAQRLVLVTYLSRCQVEGSWVCDTVHIQDGSVSHSTESMYMFSDVNGDGKDELFYSGPIFYAPVVIGFPERREHDLAVSFTDGYGKTSSLCYGYYNTPDVFFFGLSGRRVRWPLVRAVSEPDGNGGTAVTVHTYGSAVYDSDRRSLLGFGYHETYLRGRNTLFRFLHDTGHHRLALEQTLSYHLARDPGQLGGYIADPSFWRRDRDPFYHAETLNVPAVFPLPYGRMVPYDSVSSSVNRLDNTVTTTRLRLKSDGRPAWTSVLVRRCRPQNGTAPAWLELDSTAYTYATVTMPNGKQVRKPSVVKTWHRRNGSSQSPWRRTAFEYGSGRLTSVTVTDSDGAVQTTSYTYNAFGLPLTGTLAPHGLPPAVTTYAYDGKGRFVTGETDALGRTRSVTYDPTTGLPVSETGIDGLSTGYSHDAFGRLTAEARPDGTVRRTEYLTNDVAAFPEAVWYTSETEEGLPERRTYRDILGRTVHTYEAGKGYHDIVYDSLGRVWKTTGVPYAFPTSQLKKWNATMRDSYGRPLSETGPYRNLSYEYFDYLTSAGPEHFVTVTDRIRGTQRTTEYDAMGRPSRVTDPGGTLRFSYAYQTVSGKVRDRMAVHCGADSTVVLSDTRGNRLSIQDPDGGMVTCTYDALNRLTGRTDANGNHTAYTYDLTGRVTGTVFSDGALSETVEYTYDTAEGNGAGRPASVRRNGSDERVYAYDTLGRPSSLTFYDGNTPYVFRYGYDSLGRLLHLTYPDGFQTEHLYNGYGQLYQIKDASDHRFIYSVDARNGLGLPQRCRYGNGTGTEYSYNAYGMVTAIRNGIVSSGGHNQDGGGAGNVGRDPVVFYSVGGEYRQLAYTYDTRGFIATRSDAGTGHEEAYSYDALDRLASYTVNGVTAASFTYDGTGNIVAHSRVGSYSYGDGGAGPHAVTAIAAASGCPVPSAQCDVAYGLRNMPSSVSEDGDGVSIDYDAEGTRRHTRFFHGGVLQKAVTRISDLHEVETAGGATRSLDYIFAGDRVVAVHVRNGSADSLYYVLTDHLGSWEKVLDEGRNTVQQTHFDPWGNRMSYTAWDTPQTQVGFPFSRGFTGHEHYDRFKIINANARLYDPVIGRFFSPDPFVQTPDFTQSYNRYSYCMNNPVMYSDPNGEFVIVDSWIVGFVSKLFETSSLKQSWQEANKRAINDVKIWGGLFAMDPNKNFWGKIGEVVSRFTWQVPQTFVGWLVAESCNTLGFGGGVESVDYKYGATVTRTNNSGWGAVTLSSYITGDNSIRADANNSLFQHEYGHYIQSQATGIFYLPRYGIPSGLNCLGPNKYRHKYHPVEQDANIRAFKYFNDNIDGFNQWDSDRHPINGYVWSLPFTDDNNQNALANGRLRPAWYDYFLIFSPLWDAYINWLVLENY